MKYILFVLALLLVSAPSVYAQTTTVTVDGTSGVSFPKSPDHDTVVGGIAVVTSYQLDVFAVNTSGAVVFSFGLGKPAPDATGVVAVKPVVNFGAIATGQYVATVTAIGPGGQVRSMASDFFVRVGPPAAPGKPTVVR